MRDEPTGQYVSRQRGMGVTAKKYHLYQDCSLLLGGRGRTPSENFEVIEVDDRIIDLLALTPCSTCRNRSESVSALDVIAEGLLDFLKDAFEVPDAVAREAVDGGAAALIERLENHSYKIRAVSKRTAPR